MRAPPAVQAPRATPLTGRDVPRGTPRSPAVTQRPGSRRSTRLALGLGTSEQGRRSLGLRTHQVHRASPSRTARAPRAPARTTLDNGVTGRGTTRQQRQQPSASRLAQIADRRSQIADCRSPPSASDLRRTRPEERGDGVCPSALGNSASFMPPQRSGSGGIASGLDLLASTATIAADEGSAAAPPPLLDPDGRTFERNKRSKRPAVEAAPTPAQLDAVQQLVRALQASSATPERSLTAAVAQAFGTHRPYAATHTAIAAAAYAALHPMTPIADLPPHLRAPQRSMAAWRTTLDPAFVQAVDRRAARPRHAADLRPELPEERGEGDAASAFCTSASHPVHAPGAQRGPPPPAALADIQAASLPPGHPGPTGFRTRSPGADRRASEGFAPRPGRQATLRAHSTPDARKDAASEGMPVGAPPEHPASTQRLRGQSADRGLPMKPEGKLGVQVAHSEPPTGGQHPPTVILDAVAVTAPSPACSASGADADYRGGPAGPPPPPPPPRDHRHSEGARRRLADAVTDFIEYQDEFSSDPPPAATRAVWLALGNRPFSALQGAAVCQAITATIEGATHSRNGHSWRAELYACAQQIRREQRRTRLNSAAQLRAEREEERGEGTAASALCNSASLARDACTSQKVLILFSGSYARDDSMQAFLEKRGFEVTMVDNDPAHGDPTHDFTSPAFYRTLRQRVASGEFFAIWAGPPCSTFSVSRFFKALQRRQRARGGDGGPPPVRTRSHPQGLSPPPQGHEAELQNANAIIDLLCELLTVASDVGTQFVIEQPADRGDRSVPHTFLFADHAPLWIYPSVTKLRAHAGCRTCTFAMCNLGAKYQKYTTLMYTPALAPWFDDWDNWRCSHASHAEMAGGVQDEAGQWPSSHSAAYPAAMNQSAAQFLHAARQHAVSALPPPPPPPPPSDCHRCKRARDEPRPPPPPATVHIVPIYVGTRALACVPAGGGLFSTVVEGANGAARKAATAAAAEHVPRIASGARAEAVFLAGLVGSDHIAVGVCLAPPAAWQLCESRAQMLARALEFGPQAPVWCTLDAIAEGIGSDSDAATNDARQRTYHAAAAAIARTLSHAMPCVETDAPALAIGADVGGPVGHGSADAAAPADFNVLLRKAEAADAELRSELLRLADGCNVPGIAAACRAWADRFVPPPLADIPDELRAQARDFSSCAHLASLPFAQRCAIPVTQPLPPPAAQQPCADGWTPRCLEDVLTPDAIRRIQLKLAELRKWHAARRRGEEARRPLPLALGIRAFQPRARGRLWDLRACKADGSGTPVLMDTVTPPFQTHLQVEYIEQLFASLADRELVSMLRFGVCVHAQLEPQIVIMPNLLSLYDGQSGIDEAARAVSELSSFGWWQQHDFIPFAPWRCAPRGAVPRKDGGVARGIVDQGAPRVPLFTRPEHEPVQSLNDACRAGKTRVEIKPRFADLARNASILRHIADSIDQPVFTIAFDFSKYFHQCFFRPDELHRMGSMLPLSGDDGLASELLSIHTEMVMSMGLVPSSEIAQRLANALMQVFAQRLRAAEQQQQWPQSAREREWREQRAALPHDMLGPADRMFDCMMYTDDPIWTVVGVQRTALAIQVWHEMVDGSGLMPAKTPKWQIGAGAVWLGGCCYPSLGVMWVPRDKALRVRQRIQTVLDVTCTPKEYQEIIGFLEHVVDIGKFPRGLMAYLHEPMRAGGECDTDPHGRLPPDGRRDGYLRKWCHILLNVPGASLLAACELPGTVARGTSVWRLRSDAMLEPYGAAMGGCLYGAWWRFPLQRPQLTIPVLELLAACVNFVIFAGELRGAQHVVMEIDALASPTVLRSDRARSAGLRAVLAEFRDLPELREFTATNALHCAHCFGEGNPLGDAASRDMRDVLRELGAALGLRMRQVHMGADALAFINRVLARLDAEPLTFAEIEFDSTLGYPGEGPCDAATPSPLAPAAAASPSPALIAFMVASEARASVANAASGPYPPAATIAAASPPPRLHFAAASPSPAPAPNETRASPPAPPATPLSPTPAAPGPAAHPAPASLANLATADPWCASLIPDASATDDVEAAHRALVATECARAAAEQLVPSLLAAATSTAAPPLAPRPDSAPSAASTSAGPAAPAAHTGALSHAARARAAALAALLRDEAGAGGMRLEEGEADHLSLRLVQLLEGAAARNTLSGERSAWKHWTSFCFHRNVDPFRPDVRNMTHAEYDKETLTLALALLFIYGRMGCRKGRKKPPRPASALAVLRSVRRAHARLGVNVADLSVAARLADALNREYIDAHGWEALQVDRVAPLTNPIIAGMIDALSVAGDSVKSVMGRALWATMAQTGFRKAEVSLGSGARFGNDCLTRYSLRWRIGGVSTADPTREQLESLSDGDLAILIPPKSKCDQFGLEWGQAPIYLRFSSTAPICAARALRDVELALPRHGRQDRESTALFTNDDGTPLTSQTLDALFKACLSDAGVPRRSTARYSPHSFRRYLACALKAMGVADGTIQALLRWKTSESLKLYSFLSDESYADLVDSAGHADVASVRTNALPRADLLDAAAQCHAASAAIAAAARVANATPAADDDAGDDAESSDASDDDEPPRPPPPPANQRKRKRGLPATSPTDGAAPPPPLTLANAIGRSAVVPARVWPDYPCDERNGAGWEVTIDQADKRLGAVLVKFVNARHASGVRYASEWLELSHLEPL